MENYPYLADYNYWTLTDTRGVGNKGLTISDENATLYLTAIRYPEDVYEDIYKQAGEYCLIEDNVTFNFNRIDEERNQYKSYIPRKSVIVRDNKFVGMLTCGTYVYEVHRSVVERNLFHGILFTDGTTAGTNYTEYECQPGNFRSRTDYSIKKR